jgi:hypothetical protein
VPMASVRPCLCTLIRSKSPVRLHNGRLNFDVLAALLQPE